jgi:hypothetical protein
MVFGQHTDATRITIWTIAKPTDESNVRAKRKQTPDLKCSKEKRVPIPDNSAGVK